jgi:hypothetical protein
MEPTHLYYGRPCYTKKSLTHHSYRGKVRWHHRVIVIYTDNGKPKRETVSKKFFEKDAYTLGMQLPESSKALKKMKSLLALAREKEAKR